MRVLVDESLPRKLAREIVGHEATHVRDQRWTGLRNGVLLRAAADAGFNVLITADGNLPFQQNLAKLRLSVVAGVHNAIEDLRPLVPDIVDAIAMIRPGEWLQVTPRRGESISDAPFVEHGSLARSLFASSR